MNKQTHRVVFRPGLFILAILGLYLTSANVLASSYTVSVATTALFGTSAQLVFDLIDGGTPANSVTISSFATDGTLGSSSRVGDVSGTLPNTLILNDTVSPINSYLSAITLGNALSFVFETTNNAPDDPNSSPDGFAFYIFNALGEDITTTADPSGLNALLVLDITGESDEPVPYSGSSPSVPVTITPTAVPIPASSILFLSSLMVVMRRLRLTSSPSA